MPTTMKQIGLAVHNYHSATEKLPYAVQDYQDATDATATYVTGFILLMPYLEHGTTSPSGGTRNCHATAHDDSDGDGYTNLMLAAMLIPTYVCPRR